MTDYNPLTTMLESARDFRRASRQLSAAFNTADFSVRATVAAQTISIELYLKYLHARATGAVPSGHDVLQLYGALDEPTKERLHKAHRATWSPLHVLKTHDEVFVDWRDPYEEEMPLALQQAFGDLGLLIEAFEEVAGKSV